MAFISFKMLLRRYWRMAMFCSILWPHLNWTRRLVSFNMILIMDILLLWSIINRLTEIMANSLCFLKSINFVGESASFISSHSHASLGLLAILINHWGLLILSCQDLRLAPPMSPLISKDKILWILIYRRDSWMKH